MVWGKIKLCSLRGHSDSRLGENYSCSGEQKLFHRNAINLNDDATDRVSFRSLPGENAGDAGAYGGRESRMVDGRDVGPFCLPI